MSRKTETLGAFYHPPSQPSPQTKPTSQLKRLATAALISLSALWILNSRSKTSLPAWHDKTERQVPSWPSSSFDWPSIKPSKHLEYSACYENSQCARLQVPMDWFNGTTDASITIAVIRQPAPVPVTHPQYGGAILLNPGGPGGSGVGFLRHEGGGLRWIVDSESTEEGGKFFDLISFDPRGVGFSTPRVDCFHDPNLALTWSTRVLEEGWFESSDAAFGRLWSMSDALLGSCSGILSEEGGNRDVKRFVSTASVARDMLEIVERHGEWREKEAKALLQPDVFSWSSLYGLQSSRADVLDLPTSVKYLPGKEKIQYYGFSYGSYLGGTFAAMFPERVGRLAVDGVVDFQDYRSANWSSGLLASEKTIELFYHHCARVGFPTCALAKENGQSKPADIKKRTDDIIQSLYHNPLPVYQPRADVLSYSELRLLIFAALYSPVTTFPSMASLLAAIESRNGSALAPVLGGLHISACASDNPDISRFSQDAQVAIACGDADSQTYMNRTAFQTYAQDLAARSPSSGSMWAQMRMQCVHYTLPAMHRFTGPWEDETSHPLLFIGNTADPVTPGRNAVDMAKGFKGAVALLQDSGGHCSLAAFSRCTTGWVRRYFQTGELPPANTTCAADVEPFGPTMKNVPGDVGGQLCLQAQRHERTSNVLLENGAAFFGGAPWRSAWRAIAQV